MDNLGRLARYLILVTFVLFVVANVYPMVSYLRQPQYDSSVASIKEDTQAAASPDSDSQSNTYAGAVVDVSLEDDTQQIDAVDSPKEHKASKPQQSSSASELDNSDPYKGANKDFLAAIRANTRKSAKYNILLTAVANSGMAEYTLNWIESLKRCKLDDKYLVIALDDSLTDILTEHGYGDHVVNVPSDWLTKPISSDFATWLKGSYRPITQAKSLVVQKLIDMDVTVWFSDVDIVFTSPHIYQYLMKKLTARRRKTHILFSQETEDDLINSGFYIMTPTKVTKDFLSESLEIQDKSDKLTQQMAMNELLKSKTSAGNDYRSGILRLDLMLFPQGREFFDYDSPHKYGLDPMIVHANFRVGDKKKETLQAHGYWYLEE